MAMIKDWIEGRLVYNNKNERYSLIVNNQEKCDFHCGDGLQVSVDEDQWVDTCFEMAWTENGSEWYLVDTSYRGKDIEHVRARIRGWVEVD